jgi:hemoglobin
MPFFNQLVGAFYTRVAEDAVLLPLYPEAPDLTGARHRLTLFLAQYWGGPHTYDDERGHPMLRMRHMPFRIGPAERDHWLANMSAAVAEVCADRADTVDDGVADELMAYFRKTAEHMRNDTGMPITSASYGER